MARWTRRLGVGVAALLVVGMLAVAIRHATLPRDRLDVVSAGALDVAARATGSWRLDDLEVRLTDRRLLIEQEGRTVWASVPGTAFLAGARGDVSWEEHRGYFWADVGIDARLRDLAIESVEASEDTVVLRGRLTGDAADTGVTVRVAARPDGGAILDAAADDETTTLALTSGRSPGAGVHGLGAQFSAFDLEGLIPIVVREQGVGRGEQPLTFLADLTNRAAGGSLDTTYAARASFVTDDLRGVRLDPDAPASHAFAVADLRDPAQVTLHSWAPTLRAELTSGESPLELVAQQSAGTQRPELAAWTADGAVVGLQGGTEKVRDKLRTLLDAGARISGVWLQDWTGQRTTSFGDRLWWTWQLDEQRYPDWPVLVDELADRGIRTTTYVNPFLVDADAPGAPAVRNLWAEAAAAGHLVADEAGDPVLLDQGGYSASLIDLTDPSARSWFADIIAEEVLADGVSGFMADFGEGLPFDAVLADGDPRWRHNEWPRLWAETVRLGCERAGRPDCVTWFRSGALGQEEYASTYWAGDQLVSWSEQDGLRSALLGILSSGVSGWPLVHSDVGGYTSIDAVVKDYTRSPELLARWAELEAFGVLMRTHEGNRPDVNTQVYSDPGTAEAFAGATRLYAALAPYREAVVDEAVETGVPALRHGWLTAPGSPAADVDTQFFLGSDVLVAPVLDAGATTVDVALPAGSWTHLITGERLDGSTTATVDAPLGTPAAFVRTDSPWAERLVDAVSAAHSAG